MPSYLATARPNPRQGSMSALLLLMLFAPINNIHKKDIKYLFSSFLLYYFTKITQIAFEGREIYDKILFEDNYFKEFNNIGAQGDVIIASGQRKHE